MIARSRLLNALLPLLLLPLPPGPALATPGEGDPGPDARVAAAFGGESLGERWQAIRSLDPREPDEARALLKIALDADEPADLKKEAVDRIETIRDARLWGDVLCCADRETRLYLLDDLDLTLGDVDAQWDGNLVSFYAMALRDSDPDVRLAALEELGGDPWFLTARETAGLAVTALYGDPTPELRSRVVALLASIPGEEGSRQLLGILLDTDEPPIRMAASRALAGRLDNRREIEELVRTFRRGDLEIRQRLAGTFGYAAYATVLPDLIAALDDPDSEVRAGAATSLGGLIECGIPGALDAVYRLASLAAEPGEDEAVRSRAVAALARLGCGDRQFWANLFAAAESRRNLAASGMAPGTTIRPAPGGVFTPPPAPVLVREVPNPEPPPEPSPTRAAEPR